MYVTSVSGHKDQWDLEWALWYLSVNGFEPKILSTLTIWFILDHRIHDADVVRPPTQTSIFFKPAQHDTEVEGYKKLHKKQHKQSKWTTVDQKRKGSSNENLNCSFNLFLFPLIFPAVHLFIVPLCCYLELRPEILLKEDVRKLRGSFTAENCSDSCDMIGELMLALICRGPAFKKFWIWCRAASHSFALRPIISTGNSPPLFASVCNYK